jgi:hypothetical protein
MAFCQPHNLRRPPTEEPKPYGIRVSLRGTDPFQTLVGSDWSRTHWYTTAAERDAEMADMSRRHDYSRSGDKPVLIFQKIENLAASRGL